MTSIFFKDDNPRFRNRIDYVLDYIERHPLANGAVRFFRDDRITSDLLLCYGVEKPGAFFMPSQKVVFNEAMPGFDQLAPNVFHFHDQSLYSLENRKRRQEPFIKGNHFQFDLIETIFYHISRFEEWHYSAGREDRHGRMDSRQQFLVKNRLYRKPVVDLLVLNFLKALGIRFQDKKTAYRITHDIDFIVRKNNPLSIIRTMAGSMIKRSNFRSALRVWQNRREENAYDTFEWMLRKEENIEKAIYFLMGGASEFDNQYSLDLPVVQKAFQLSRKRNYRIGIHPSYETWKDISVFQAELEKLQEAIGEKILYTRQHYLRFSPHHTPEIIQTLGLKEDSSLGYADRIGFRCGTGFGYYLYDFANEKAFGFLETPLIIMDSALITEAGRQPETIKKIWHRFLSENEYNTKITFNFHNSRFYDARIQGIPLKALYESLFSNDISDV